ncbi:hypothetical protein HDU93_002452, partial [Gonapodya sp. JEL0774]
MAEPVVTRCAHFFCKACITKVIQTAGKCPMCRRELVLGDQIPLPTEPEQDTEAGDDGAEVGGTSEAPSEEYKSSSKIEAVMGFLRTTRARDPSIKTIIFSQWSSMLDLMEPAMRKNGIQFTRFDGSMNRKKREASIKTFTSDPACNVFLSTLKSGGLGLNLTAASQVFLVDPWWNPSIEDQAVDRCYRLGQSRPVSVFRFVVSGTVEDRVIEIQKRKRALVKQAFGNRSGESQLSAEKAREARLEDLLALLGVNGGGEPATA